MSTYARYKELQRGVCVCGERERERERVFYMSTFRRHVLPLGESSLIAWGESIVFLCKLTNKFNMTGAIIFAETKCMLAT
jgi:hypothetical protein